MRKPLLMAVAGACLALSTAPSALAEQIPDLSDRLIFEVAGHVTPRCELDQFERTVSLGSLTDSFTGGSRAARAQMDVRIDCNAPFAVSFTSSNGGLRNDARAQRGSVFRDLVTYTVTMDAGAGDQLRRSPCRSEQMTAGRTCYYSLVDANGEESLARVSLEVPADARPLLEGQFSDQLRLRVSPLLGGEAIAQSIE